MIESKDRATGNYAAQIFSTSCEGSGENLIANTCDTWIYCGRWGRKEAPTCSLLALLSVPCVNVTAEPSWNPALEQYATVRYTPVELQTI